MEIAESTLLSLMLLDPVPHGRIEVDVKDISVTGASTRGIATETGVDLESTIKERQVIKGIVLFGKGIDPLTNIEGFVLHFVDQTDWIRRRMHLVIPV